MSWVMLIAEEIKILGYLKQQVYFGFTFKCNLNYYNAELKASLCGRVK